jgi:hypothetical protein
VGGQDDQVWHLLFEREDFAGQVADQKQRRPGCAGSAARASLGCGQAKYTSMATGWTVSGMNR